MKVKNNMFIVPVFSFLKKLKISLFLKKPFFFLFKNKDLEAAFFTSKGLALSICILSYFGMINLAISLSKAIDKTRRLMYNCLIK